MITASLFCLIVGVTDGDTIKARCGEPGAYQQVTVRLAEIDAPELGQPFGRRAKQHLSDLCFQVEATIKPTARDRWGRTVARVECRGVDANLAMVRDGFAWAFTKYQTDAQFPKAELAARQAGAGMWAEHQQAPWAFRHPTSPFAAVADANGCITGPKGGRYRLMPDGGKRYGC